MAKYGVALIHDFDFLVLGREGQKLLRISDVSLVLLLFYDVLVFV